MAELNSNFTEKVKLLNWLFETNAVRVCEEGKPFWYTSGTIGPYFINTHFLYGNEKKANDLLSFIDENAQNRKEITNLIYDKVYENYTSDKIFRDLINTMLKRIQDTCKEDFDYVSGGERRDWFFSVILAHLLNKPHITIFKDLTAEIWDNSGVAREISDVRGKKILHIADLVTEGSSYERAWIPAIDSFGAKMIDTCAVVDRKQGGRKLIESFGVRLISMLDIDNQLFEMALEQNLISKSQFEMIRDYQNNPNESMRNFLIENPDFIKDSLKKDAKTRERAELCLKKNIYNIVDNIEAEF